MREEDKEPAWEAGDPKVPAASYHLPGTRGESHRKP